MEEVKKEVKKAKPEQKKRTGNSVTGKPLDQIDTKPQLDSVTEEAGKAVVLTYGRFNPPTTGHEKLVDKVKAHAKKLGADHLIVASHSQDAKKNPLTADQKLHHLHRAFPDTNVAVSNKEHPSFIHQLKKLSGKYDHVHMVVGSDRVSEFEKVAHKYNGKEYNFKSIHIVSAGHRDPDAEGTEGMSASKMREHVKNNDIDSFKKGAPSKMSGSHVQRMFHDIRSGMGLHEEVQIDEKKSLTVAQRQVRARQMRTREPKLERKREMAKRKIAGKEQLQRRSMSAAREIVKRRFSAKKGVRYQELTTSEKMAVDRAVETKSALIKKLASRLMPKIRQAEYARFKSFTSGTPMQSMHSKPATIAASYEPSAIDKLFEQFFSKEQSRPLQTVVEADGADSRNLDVLLRLGLADPEQLQMFRRAMKDPEKAVKEPLLRGKLVAVLNKIMDIVTKDPSIFAKTRMKIQQKEQKALFNKSQQTGLPLATIEEVYTRGFENPHAGMTQEQSGFARVNSFIAGGKAAQEDNDLLENFMDGKGPGKPGDAARHGLKGKSTAELKSIRSSDSVSPRKKQLAHFMINMTKKESADINDVLEGLKDPKDNPCCDGYKPVGTKKKAGKIVPNCVPESVNENFNIAYAAGAAGVGVTLTAGDLGMKMKGGFELHPSVLEEEEVEEDVKTSDKEPVIIPSHMDASGHVIPAKTVMRRVGKKIIKSGNVHDGEG